MKLLEGLLRPFRSGRPDLVEANRRRFDEVAGYADYHASCRSRFERTLSEGPHALGKPGFERLRVISAADAADLRERIEARFSCDIDREKSQHLLAYRIDDPSFDRALLEQILTSALDEHVTRHFESEYLVYWYSVSRAVPVAKLGRNSFRWHCDRGPRDHLKLLLYLNDFDEHGGGSEFLDIETTRRIGQTGYVFAPVKTRRNDLTRIASRVGTTVEPWQPQMGAGEGILFPPSQVLHRGIVPTRGPRVVVTVCLLPSPIPWRAALERGGLAAEAGEKWHSHASVLRDQLVQTA